jgi:hypothetical protein
MSLPSLKYTIYSYLQHRLINDTLSNVEWDEKFVMHAELKGKEKDAAILLHSPWIKEKTHEEYQNITLCVYVVCIYA